MLVNQISVFLENKEGRLAEVTKLLSNNEIDIRALSIADTTDFGILRLIVNKPDEAKAILKKEGFIVKSTNVIAIELEDRPGSLSDTLHKLDEYHVSIEYLYAFVSKQYGKAYVVLRIENEEVMVDKLKNSGLTIVESKTIYDL